MECVFCERDSEGSSDATVPAPSGDGKVGTPCMDVCRYHSGWITMCMNGRSWPQRMLHACWMAWMGMNPKDVDKYVFRTYEDDAEALYLIQK